MSYPEFLDWVTYVKNRGPLNVGTRVEQGVALLATMISRTAGGKAKMEDFLPQRGGASVTPPEASAQDVLLFLRAKASQTKKEKG